MEKDWLTLAAGRARYVQFYACTQASTEAAEAFVPKPTDVIVATYSKTGTTVLQMLLEMLRSRGDTSFDEITAVQPWIDFCHDIGIDVDAPQPHHPRLFKSHQRPAALNRGARIASVVREPRDVVKSYYAFYVQKDHPLVQGKSLDEWAREWANVGTSNGTVWEYYVQLFQCRCALGTIDSRAAASSAPLMLLEYSALASDLPTHARRCAEWLQGGGGGNGETIDTSPENIERAARLASRDAMGAMVGQFDDHYLNEKQRAAGCETVMQMAAKVVKAGATRPQLSKETEELLERTWQERVTPHTGLASYAELAAKLADDHALWRDAAG